MLTLGDNNESKDTNSNESRHNERLHGVAKHDTTNESLFLCAESIEIITVFRKQQRSAST